MGVIISYITIDNPVKLVGTIFLGMCIYFVVMVVMKGITRIDIQRAGGVFNPDCALGAVARPP